ncbi:MAG: VOC family protein [Oscillospiraceae bacterium]|nr:VOC family protein [Oscillospiraceae bacterium]
MKFRIDHVNLNVTDMDKSLAFYEKALGLKLVRKNDAKDGSFVLAFITDDAGLFNIELTWLRDKEGRYELGDNETHIAFRPDDYDAAHELHSQMGVICYENASMGLYFIEDPDGYWLEICPVR